MKQYIKCEICGKLYKRINMEHVRTHNITLEKYKEKYNVADTISEQTRYNLGNATRRGNNPTKGRKRTIEEKELMSKNRKGKGIGVAGKYERTKEIREKISKSVAQLYVDGKTNFITGHYISTKILKKCYYRSSWELKVMKYLDFNNNIEYWEHEPFYIPYKDENGDDRNYVPDFLVFFSCGIKELWEVKPRELLALDRNICKLKGLNEFLEKNDMNGFVIDEIILEKLKKYMEGVNERIF